MRFSSIRMTQCPVATSILATMGEISQRHEAMMNFTERITKQLGRLKEILEASRKGSPASKISFSELNKSLGEILRYIEANILESNDTRELIVGFQETLDGITVAADRKLTETRLELSLSDCYLITEGLLAARDIGYHILKEVQLDQQKQRPQTQQQHTHQHSQSQQEYVVCNDFSENDQDDDLSIQVDVLSESIGITGSIDEVEPKFGELQRRVKFDKDNGSSLSSLPESTMLDSCAINPFAGSKDGLGADKEVSKTSVQAKLAEFLAIRANVAQKKQTAPPRPPVAKQQSQEQHSYTNQASLALNLSVTSVESATNDSINVPGTQMIASASVIDPLDAQKTGSEADMAPIQFIKALESISEIEGGPLNDKKPPSKITTSISSVASGIAPPSSIVATTANTAVTVKHNKSCGSGLNQASINSTGGNRSRTPLKAINTPHQAIQATPRAVSAKKLKPIVLLSTMASTPNGAKSPKQHAQPSSWSKQTSSPAKVVKPMMNSTPVTPTKIVSPNQAQSKTQHNTPTLPASSSLTPPRLSSAFSPTVSPKISTQGKSPNQNNQAKILIRTLEDQIERQNNVIRTLKEEIRCIKKKLQNVQIDYNKQEEEMKQILVEFTREQTRNEEEVATIKEKLAEQQEIANYWKEKALELEQTNKQLQSQLVLTRQETKKHSISSPSHSRDHDGVHSLLDVDIDFTTLSTADFNEFQMRYHEGLLDGYYSPEHDGQIKRVSVADLYALIGTYERTSTELDRQNAELEEKLNAYKGLFRAMSNN